MGKGDEIERRWIVTGFNDPLSKIKRLESVRMRQGYLEGAGQIRVRVYDRPAGPKAELTKKTGKGILRHEESHDISVDAATMLLSSTGYVIDKTRYYRDGWEVDFFHGRLEGLVLAERELGSVDEPCPVPGWLRVGPEVTETLSNRQLALTSHCFDEPVEKLVRRSSAVPRAVLTGGPCAGKSTLIEMLRPDPGFHCIPELATVMMGQFGIMPDDELDFFQRTLYRIQRSIEEGAARRALRAGERAVLLDRGTLDSAGFIPGGWRELEAILGSTREAEYENYDHVILLPVPSREVYDRNRDSNPVRRETWEQAISAEEKLREAWEDHPRFVVLDVGLEERPDAVRRVLRSRV